MIVDPDALIRDLTEDISNAELSYRLSLAAAAAAIGQYPVSEMVLLVLEVNLF